MWSARDAVPTHVQFGVELQHVGQLAAVPPEKVSAEVVEAARRIGQDLYQCLTLTLTPTPTLTLTLNLP